MVIYFLRHASAGQHLANPKKDEKRPLDKDGIDQCGIVGRALTALDVQVDVIISSPLKRAAQTASLVGNELSYEGKLQFDDALRPGSTFADFRRMLEKYARQESIMVVGHNPNLSEFLGRIISEAGCEAGIDLRKGAVSKVEMARNSALLHWCLTPKVLRTLYSAAVAESSRPKSSRK
jgi:phosphohistidine phosphatase